MNLSENLTTCISKSFVTSNLLVFPVTAAHPCPWDNQVLIFFPYTLLPPKLISFATVVVHLQNVPRSDSVKQLLAAAAAAVCMREILWWCRCFCSTSRWKGSCIYKTL